MTEISADLFCKLKETIQILEDLVEVVKDQGEMIKALNAKILKRTSHIHGHQHYSIDDYCYNGCEDSLASSLEESSLDGMEEMMEDVHIEDVNEMWVNK